MLCLMRFIAFLVPHGRDSAKLRTKESIKGAASIDILLPHNVVLWLFKDINVRLPGSEI
jgi:hypothetical protein